jgi:hypothetical protein
VGNALFVALALATIFFGMVKRPAFVALVIVMAGIPTSLLTGDTKYFVALGGMSGQAAWAFAIVIGCLAALIAYLARLHQVLARTPAFLLFLLFALISLSWAGSLLDGLRMLAKYAGPMLFFWVLLAMEPGARLVRRLELALYAGCAIACALAIVNTLGGGFIAPLPAKSGVLGMNALAAPYTSAANFSFLVVCGAITAYCRFLASRRVLHLLITGFFLLCVAFAFVRISLAGAVLGFAIVHLVRARLFATPVFVALAVLATVLTVTSDAFMERMFFVPERVQWSQAISDPEKFLANVNTSGRTLLWSRAERAFAEESQWVGAGVGSVDAWINTGDSLASELHSEVYRVRLELGWIGLGIYLLGLLALWWRLVRATRRANRQHVTVAMRASCALLPAYFLTLLTDNTINYASGFGVAVYGFGAIATVEIAATRAAGRTSARAPAPGRRASLRMLHGSVVRAD